MNHSWKEKGSRGKWVGLLVLLVSLAIMAVAAGVGSLMPSTPTTTGKISVGSGDSVNLGYIFGNFRPPEFCGYKYEDRNGNGRYDPNERGLPGVLVTLNGIDGMGRSVSLSTVTGPDGSFSFKNLWPGLYTVTEYPGVPIPPGTTPWTPCTPPETSCTTPCTGTPTEAPPPPVVPCNATCTGTPTEAPPPPVVPCNATCTGTPAETPRPSLSQNPLWP